MTNMIKRFLRDEGGAVTVDSVAVLGGSVWMAAAIVGDISIATMNLTDKIEDRLEYSNILAEILSDYGPGSDPESNAEFCAGNPGNAKCVGNAGENPNGQDGWGGETHGMSDGDNGNGGGNGNGNNGGGNGNGNNGGGNGNNG